MRSDFPVPPVFCITAEAYRYFTTKTGLTQLYRSIFDSGSAYTQNVTLQSSIITEKILAEKIPQEITDAICSAYGNLVGRGTLVAVRSSALAVSSLSKSSNKTS
ncbi:PEP/pyruvate-binding domain-containing protein [Desulfoscipio gibsoniae]|uniref:PEP/pyruvate-binding domain-containing protein n=1 Tax=Desulfoscipio gibsoniae TaxID=102134 RepID=UPI00338E14F9